METSTAMRSVPAAGPRSSSPQPNEEETQDSNARKANVRKRTKTGCLTCRKRRIKCDEAKPTCKNCIKSRRHCDGYNQRVIFKEPIGSLSAPFGSAYTVGPSHIVHEALAGHHDGQPSRVPLQAIAPRPPAFDFNQPMPTSYRPDSIQFHLPYHDAHLMDMHLLREMNAGNLFPQYVPPFPNQLLPEVQPQNAREYTRPRPAHGLSPLIFEEDNQVQGLSEPVLVGHDVVRFSHQIQPTRIFDTDFHRDAVNQIGQIGNAPSITIPPNIGGPPTSYPPSHPHPLASTSPSDEHDEDRSMPDSDLDYRDAHDIVAPAMNVGIQHGSATEVRTFGAYAASWAVSAYLDHPHAPEFWHSGLRDIFMHFVNVTGATITLYEPRAFDHNPSQGEHVAGNALWKSAFPQMALRHPALLQSMLALASLQLAKLQNYTQAAALKHYHLALRRVGKIVQSDLRRKHPATLAATMLLAYFEVWTADHSKWSQHLWGASILLSEIPLKDMARRCLPTKRRRQLAQQRRHINSYFPGFMPGPQPTSQKLDYDLLSIITGITVTADDYGDISSHSWETNSPHASEKEVETFEIYSDLFWWYCKMEVYQSFLAGTKLFMNYEQWTQCPPRAPASDAGTTFGTYDHLMLLMGRLSDFSFKDRARKRKVAESRAGGAAKRSPQMFPGMLPVHGKVREPTGFNLPREASPQSDSNEDFDPQERYQSAIQEWESIYTAFQVFKAQLGPEFGKLDSEYGDLQDTPFGPAIQYRSYAIAGIWMNFYMGLIQLYRSHPDMPPASLQAAGLQAAKTWEFALEIGRISAGTVLDLSGLMEINTLIAAVLIESSFCLFIAGVQFRDAAQRQWLVQRMFDTSRLTGWQSANQIAAGCESSWIKAFELNVGPPYARSTLFSKKSIWDNPRRIDSKIRELAPGDREYEPLVLAKADQAEYALGLLGVEDDLQVLELED